MWLCNNCEQEQEFLLYKAGKTMQQELESIRDDMSKKLDTMTVEIQKLRVHTQEPPRESHKDSKAPDETETHYREG
jgi:hypothetical protein